MALADAIEQQLAGLARRYGQPQRVTADLPQGGFSPLSKSDRYGEVCMVVRRPNGHLLTARKLFYPPAAYRLLTGGVSHGEGIEAALLREVAEETGLAVAVRRFLAVIDYRVPPLDAGVFVTFAFLLDELGGVLMPQDEAEQIADFREVPPAALPGLAAVLEQSPDAYSAEIQGNWRAWGCFRAVVHRVVYETLATGG